MTGPSDPADPEVQPDGVEARQPDRSWIGWVAFYLVTLYLVWYLSYAAILALFANEGPLPPTWRDPDIPAGAEVASVTERCDNGGCRREIRIVPADGQDAEDLAVEMGLDGDGSRTYGWRPTNPASVEAFLPYGYRGKTSLRVVVQYDSPFPY